MFDRMDAEKVRGFSDRILKSRAVFVLGAGRSGLLARCFAMRLCHLGLSAHIAGDALAPPLSPKDILIVASGSGETTGVLALAKKASDLGAAIALVTANPKSRLAAIASMIIALDAPNPKADISTNVPSVQPMGSLFEQGMFLFFEATALELMRARGVTAADMVARHANLE